MIINKYTLNAFELKQITADPCSCHKISERVSWGFVVPYYKNISRLQMKLIIENVMRQASNEILWIISKFGTSHTKL